MAVTTSQAKLDARALRADFPIFEQLIHGKPLAFLDSAASSQKPRQMLDEMTNFYSTSYANVHRGVYVLAERATAALVVAIARQPGSAANARALATSHAFGRTSSGPRCMARNSSARDIRQS